MKPTVRKYYPAITLLIQLLVLNVFQYIFKNYDRSYVSIWQYDSRGIALHIFFILYGLLIWNIGRWLVKKLMQSEYKNLHLWKKIVLGFTAFVAYGIAFSVIYGAVYFEFFFVRIGLEQLWTDYSLLDGDLMVVMFIVYIVVFSVDTVIHYTWSLKEAQIIAEQLKKETIQAKFEALKSQVDPHFFFNSLSVLTSLVYKDADLSAEYITQLSKMYRYILEGKDQAFASINDEIKFLNSYIFLIKVRYSDSIKFEVAISEESGKKAYLPKSSLQMLVENAIKHNRFSDDEPLLVRVSEDESYIRVVNNKNKRELIEGSSGIGLENIRKRYELIGGDEPVVQETNISFTVKLPKLSQHEAKHFDF